jgi:hypothetical protein
LLGTLSLKFSDKIIIIKYNLLYIMTNFNNDLYKKKYLKYKIKYIELKKQFGGTSKEDKTLYALIRRGMDLNRIATKDDLERALPKMPSKKPAENPVENPADSRCFGCKKDGANLDRTLKNGRTQSWHKECLTTYRKERDESRDSVITKSGGLEAAKQSMKLLGGPPAGTCTDCGEPVTQKHDRFRTEGGLVTHVGCL